MRVDPAALTGRLVSSLLTLLGVAVVVFSLVRLAPGDPVRIMLGNRATPESVDELQARFGFDRPVSIQFWDFLSGLIRGDIGTSIRTGQPVLSEIAERIGSTVQLATAALLFALVLGIVLGSTAALKAGTRTGQTVQLVILAGFALPTYCAGLLLLLVFGVTLRWLPVIDDGGPMALILPAFALGLPSGAYFARLVYGSMIEQLGSEYVRTARAKGLPERRVVFDHALQNALLPVVTVLGIQFGALLTGAAVIEILFSRPGLGRYAVQAIQNRDFPQIQGTILVIAVMFVVINFLVDLSYSVLDPRIGQQMAGSDVRR